LYGGERRQTVICSSALPLIEAQMDDELDPNGQALLRQHLELCPACRDAQARLRRLQGAIRGQDLYFRAPDSLRTLEVVCRGGVGCVGRFVGRERISVPGVPD